MSSLRPFAACALACLLGSLPGQAAPPTTSPAPATAPAPRPAPASPRVPANTYIHPGTKMPFPEKVARFQRVEITKYAPDESDISAGYNFTDPAVPIAITVYVFPAPAIANLPSDTPGAAQARQFAQALTAVKTEIAKVHPDAKTLSEADFTLTQRGRSYKGTKVSYEMNYNTAAGPITSLSDMYLFLQGNWQIEYRVSYPKAAAPLALPAIDELLTTLTWGEN